MTNKIIIITEGGLVTSVHSNINLEYLVIDKDLDSEVQESIGNISIPDTIDLNLNLSILEDTGFLVEGVPQNHLWK
jgi:hypothetical protein